MVKRKVKGMLRDIVLQASTLPEMEEKVILLQDAMDSIEIEMSWEAQFGKFNVNFWEKKSQELDNQWDSQKRE